MINRDKQKNRLLSGRICRNLFLSLIDGVALHEALLDDDEKPYDFRLIEVNPSFGRVTSIDPDKAVGRTLEEQFGPGARGLIEPFARVLASGTPETFERYIKKLERHLRITAYPLYTGVVACIISDISEEKLTAESLRESEANFRAHVENSFDVIFTLDAAGNFVFVSPAWERHFGYSAEDVMGKNFAPYVHEDDVVPCIQYLTEIMTSGRSGTSPVYRVKCSDGSYRSFVANGTPYTDTKGRRIFIGVGHDVTEQLRAEGERLDFERKLLHTQKLESLGVLAAGIAHDFNNLLQTIIGNMDLARLHLNSDNKVDKHIGIASLAAERAAELTSRLLAYTGKGTVAVSRVNLNSLARDNASMFRTATGAITTELQLCQKDTDVIGDAPQLQQVIMNLITNAAEAIEQSNGRIIITTDVVECDDTLLSQSRLEEKPAAGTFVLLDVNDNGSGMTPEVQARIFDPFFTTKFIGRGLGMSAIMGIIKGHRGAIILDSEPGRGTNVRALLPVAPPVESASEGASSAFSEESTAASLSRMSGTVLIVDDEKAVLRTCSVMARHLGLNVLTAGNAAQAIDIFKEKTQEIDLVIMDLTMPEMDGVTAMGELRRISPDVKVVLSTGYNEHEIAGRITCDQPTGFIRKPYTMKKLDDELSRIMPTA